MINQFKEYERNEMQNESRIRNKKREYIYKKNEKKNRPKNKITHCDYFRCNVVFIMYLHFVFLTI